MKSTGSLQYSTEQVADLYKGLLSNRDHFTTTRGNNEKPLSYKAATQANGKAYKVLSNRTNEILKSKIGE